MVRQWTFQKKVIVGFGVMVGLIAIIATIAVYALQTVVTVKDRLIGVDAAKMTAAAKLLAASNEDAAAFRGYLLLLDDSFLAQQRAAVTSFDKTMHGLEQVVNTTEGRRLIDEIQKLRRDFAAAQRRAIQVRKSKNGLETVSNMVRQDLLPVRDRITANLEQFIELEQSRLAASERDSDERAAMAVRTLMVVAIAAVLFAAITAVMLGRALSRQIGSAVQHVQSSSAELQTSANQQATGAKETATALNEVTTTMNELLTSSRQIMESAQQVARLADEASGAARSGDQTVAVTQESIEGIRAQVNLIVGHMLELGKKSQQIGLVLDIINELAEQTNILSINATIEAAGAGEQGKRFAVVGDEIRKLAERVGGSTKEIRGLVEEIRAAVNTTVLATEGGVKAVDAGAVHFAEVTRGFRQIGGLIGTATQAAREIELSTKQQMTAVEQVNGALSGAAQASRENAVGASQTLNTATELAHLSQGLSLIVQAPARV